MVHSGVATGDETKTFLYIMMHEEEFWQDNMTDVELVCDTQPKEICTVSFTFAAMSGVR